MRETPAMLERRPLAVLWARLVATVEAVLAADMADMRPELEMEPLAEEVPPEE